MTSRYQTTTHVGPASAVSFKPQPTQNTALVVEHRCLYTQDLRRKAKRWQDGFLRFHTFNKRVMVYDVPRNYIGDTHWREEEPVQDGDELELDRPVLVQVGEHIGNVEQDLTALLEKRHKKESSRIDNRAELHDSSPSASKTGNVPSLSPAVSTQVKPKSLNALLGRHQGTIGKASLPTQSPYELRRAAENDPRKPDPPAKRRCVAPQTRSSEDRVRPMETGVLERHANKERPVTSSSRRTNSVLARSNATAEATPSISANSRLSGNIGLSFHNESSCEVDRETRSKTRPRNLEAQGPSSSARKTQEKPAQDTLAECDETGGISSHIEVSMGSSGQKPKSRSKLRLASHKPRKKLMYKDLLPPNTPIMGQALGDNESSVVEPVPSRRKMASTDSPSQRNHDEQDRLLARLRRIDNKVGQSDEASFELEHPCKRQNRSLHSSENAHGPSTRPCWMQDAKSDAEADKLPAGEAINSMVSQANCTVHDTNLALARLDEILLFRSQPQLSEIQLTPSLEAHQSHATNDSPNLPKHHMTAASPERSPLKSTTHVVSSLKEASPVNVSPKVRTLSHKGTTAPREALPAAKSGTGSANTTALISIEPCSPPIGAATALEPRPPLVPGNCTTVGDRVMLQDTSSEATADDCHSATAVTSLPPFKSLCPTKTGRRGPFQKTVSDTSVVTSAQQAPSVDSSTTKVGDANCAKEQLAHPWSREAWDLFGCGRDGTAVDFNTFCLNEAI